MQLVAYGAQDIYLTGNPQITFFKVVYRRHTNFSVEAIEQTFSGDASLGKKVSCTVARNGDLLSRVYLEMDISTTGSAAVNQPRVGYLLIDYVELEIGGQCIDKHYGEWMDVWTQLRYDGDTYDKFNSMINGTLTAAGSSDWKLYVPLQFWFCCNPGLALPLIALQYHEVKLNVQFKPSAANVSSIDNVCVFCDYIFLDTDERRRFAQVSHEYLIEQVQFSNALQQANGTDEHELRFNHPVKELIWTLQDNANVSGPLNFWKNGGNNLDLVNDALIQLNGHDRFRRRPGTYFRVVQPFQHHTGGHSQDSTSDYGGFYCYSFALKPEDHQPSGTCNFSRIDNAVLSINATAASTIKIYAVNYNVLRIMSGMGGLAYSN